MSQEAFKNIETIYEELKGKVASGEITQDDMRAEIDQMTIQDHEGRTWRFRENWYVFLNDRWIGADPYKIDIKVKEDREEEEIRIVPQKKPEKSTAPIYKAPFFIAFMILIVAVAVIFIFLGSSNDDTIDDKGKTAEETGNQALKTKSGQDIQNLKSASEFRFPEDDLNGLGLMADEDKKPVVSFEDDAKIAATVDALKKRIQLIYGSVEGQKKEMALSTVRGIFLGFAIKSTMVKEKEKVVTDEVTLTTPTRGRIIVKHKKLASLQRTDFAKFIKDLEKAKISATYTKNLESRKINVQLDIEPFITRLDPHLLISNNKIGKIKLGIDVKGIKNLIPPSYRVISREIKDRYKRYQSFYFHKLWSRDRKPMLTINSKEGSVFKIQVESNRYKTGKGLGIGNTLGDLRAYYNGITIKQTENFTYACFKDSTTLKFILDREKIDYQKKTFPPSTGIISILLEN